MRTVASRVYLANHSRRTGDAKSMNGRHQLAPTHSFRLNRYTTIVMFASRMSTRTGCASRAISQTSIGMRDAVALIVNQGAYGFRMNSETPSLPIGVFCKSL